MVGITGQPDGRPSVPQDRSDYDDSHGCLHGGLGRSPRRLGDLGPVVVGLGQAPHQLARTTGSVADSAALSASGTGHCCGCPYGQYHYSGLHQQGGWNSVSHLVLPGTRPMGLVQATRDLPGCQPHIGSQDALSRGKHNHPTEWSLHKTVVRLIFEHWPTPNVDLFASEKNHKLSVFFSVRPSQTSSGINALTQNWESVRVRVPANQPHPEGVEEAEAAVVSPDPPSSPVLAQPAVVPSADQHADRLSASDHTQGQPPEELGHGDVLSQTGQNETGCMAAVRQSFVD